MSDIPKPIDWVSTFRDMPSLSAMPIETARFPKGPFTWTQFPPKYCEVMGVLMFIWSRLDQEFNRTLAWLAKQIPDEANDPVLRGDNLRKKADLFKELLNKTFAAEPGVVEYLLSLMTSFREAQSKRNLLVHGKLNFKVSHDGGGVISHHCISATGRYKGKRQTVEIDLNELVELQYAMGLCRASYWPSWMAACRRMCRRARSQR